ncbi:MAG: ArsC/Spx/MgsR family protein [Thermoplasmatota archaeon]
MYTLIHNPNCSKSRAALDMLEASGHEFTIRDYQQEPMTAEELRDLQTKLGSGPAQWIRWDEPEATGYEADDPEAVLIQAIVDRPRLLQRPILVCGDKAMVGRPGPEALQKMLTE